MLIRFTVGQLAHPPTKYGVLSGPFGNDVVFNKPAGRLAIENRGEFMSDKQQAARYQEVLACDLPERGDTLEEEQLVATEPPTYVM